MSWERAKNAKLKAQSMPMLAGAIIEIDGDANNYRLIITMPKGSSFPFKPPLIIGGISAIYKVQD